MGNVVMLSLCVAGAAVLLREAARHWRLYREAKNEVRRLDREIAEMAAFDRAATAHERLCRREA